MKIIIENADQRDFNELANLARQGKIHTFYMTDEEERPQGEWIIIKSPLSTETVVKCPFCHDEFIGNDVEHYNFCPICGADMRGKEE